MNNCKRFQSPPVGNSMYKNVFDYPPSCDSCTPWNPEAWKTPVKVPDGMDPGLYNVLNGCWLCNFEKQDRENQYLSNRSFFNGPNLKPCNRFFQTPKNSADEL